MLYSADGTLLQRKYIKNNATISKRDYLRGKGYKSDILESSYHKDGRVIQKVGNTYQFEYHIKDHLGNVRVTFVDDDTNGLITGTELRSRNDYYSFGMEWNNRWELGDTISPENLKRYNSKELFSEMNMENNSMLSYVCCNKKDLKLIKQSLKKYGISNCKVETHCYLE